jgi:hypothetical protein
LDFLNNSFKISFVSQIFCNLSSHFRKKFTTQANEGEEHHLVPPRCDCKNHIINPYNYLHFQAITTGGIPGFVDVVLNFDSSELQEDNLITQLHRSGRKMVFYGDDTWIRLFPDHFVRSDGTTSFFVTDYTEVRNFCLPLFYWLPVATGIFLN